MKNSIENLLSYLFENNEVVKQLYGNNFRFELKKYIVEKNGLAEYGVHYSQYPKWGVNPKKNYGLNGVYFYYLTKKSYDVVFSGFATERKYANIAKINNDRMIIIKEGHPKNFSKTDLYNSIKLLKKKYNKHISVPKNPSVNPAQGFVHAVIALNKSLGNEEGSIHINKILHSIGYDGIVDYDGTLLPIESNQGVITWPTGKEFIISLETISNSKGEKERLEKIYKRLKNFKPGTLKMTEEEIKNFISNRPKDGNTEVQFRNEDILADLIADLILRLDFSYKNAWQWLRWKDYYNGYFSHELENNPTTPKEYWKQYPSDHITETTNNKNIFLILEAKQSLMNLGFPEVIVSILNRKFGKNDFLIAKWYKDFYSSTRALGGDEKKASKDWFFALNENILEIDLGDIIKLYNALGVSTEEYKKVRKNVGLPNDDKDIDINETKKYFKIEIENMLFSDIFFSYIIIKDIESKKLKDLKPYKNLSFQDAKDAYDNTRVFSNISPIKLYKNGFKWIDVGKRCQIVGKKMKNCGSAGVMSSDPDRTIITLFDKNNNPHVVVTYSPNENRISSEEGVAGTSVKTKYHKYVIDLSKMPNAEIDVFRTKSKLLKLKVILKNVAKIIKSLNYKSTFNEFFYIVLNNGIEYYSDSFVLIPKEEIEEISKKENFTSTKQALTKIFNDRTHSGSYYGSNAIKINKFLTEHKKYISKIQRLSGIITEEKEAFEIIQSDLFRGSGVNGSTDFEEKIPEYEEYMRENGWGDMPAIHAIISSIDKEDVEDYMEAEEEGYEHELDWSRPLKYEDIGMDYANIDDGHNRSWAAKFAGVPLHIKIWPKH